MVLRVKVLEVEEKAEDFQWGRSLTKLLLFVNLSVDGQKNLTDCNKIQGSLYKKACE